MPSRSKRRYRYSCFSYYLYAVSPGWFAAFFASPGSFVFGPPPPGENIEREAVFLVMTPADIWEQKEINRRLYEAMGELTPQQRRRIYARFFLHMNNAEIARVEDCDITSVRDSINRGLRRLKKIFENLS